MTNRTSTPATVPVLRSFLLIVLFIYPVLMIVQGIDFTDMGFNLSNQWFLLHDPGIYQHGYLFYLSNLLGGLWLSLAAPFGLFWVKFGWAVVLYLTMIMAYFTLKDVGSPKGLALGLVVALLWITKLGFNWMDYNWFTGLFFTAAAFLLHRSLVNDHWGLLVGAAGVLGASVLARFPNLLALGFGFVIPLFAYLESRGWRWALRRSFAFVAGFVAGVGVILLLMLALGHLEFYVAGLEQRFLTSSEDARYMYSPDSLLSLLFVDYIRLGVFTVLAVPLLVVVARTVRWQWRWRLMAALALGLLTFWFYSHNAIAVPWWLLVVTGVVAFGCVYVYKNAVGVREPMSSQLYLVVVVVLSTALGYGYTMLNWIWLVPGLLLVFLVQQIIYAATTSQRVVAGLALAALVITPLGSGNGMINAVFGMWLAIPMGFAVLFRRLEGSGKAAGGDGSALFLTLVIASTLVASGARIAYYSTYRDTFDRGRMTAAIDHPLLRGVLTTPERAWVVQDLLNALKSHVRPGESLLLHGGCSLVYLLTDARPVLGSTWNGVYHVPKFRERLHRFEQSGANSPVVLLSKGSCRDREWPVLRRMPNSEMATLKVLGQFMKRRDYELVWQNEFFEVWKVPGSDSQGALAAEPRAAPTPRL